MAISKTKRLTATDATTTLAEAMSWCDAFLKERDWWQFHTLKDDAMDVAIEGGELAQLFRYKTEAQSRAELKMGGVQAKKMRDEAGDAFWALLLFCQNANIDLASALRDKLADAAVKYPTDAHKGSNRKYDEPKNQ